MKSDQLERAKARELFAVLRGASRYACLHYDGLALMKSMDTDSVDLVLTSPPYEKRRKYGELNFDKKGEEWVAWMIPFVEQAVRISRGLAIFVIGHGETTSYDWSATPALLMADLKRKGVSLRCPLIYRRDGVFGSGGQDYFRYNYEFVLVAQKKAAKLSWANNCAGGRPPLYGPGGAASNRKSDGTRVNQWGGNASDGGQRRASGGRQQKKRPSHLTATLRQENGTMKEQDYTPPVLANPGCVVQQTYTAAEVDEILEAVAMGCLSDHKVGGNHLGHKLAHQNEAPFPLSLAERYVLSFCPPDGVVLDCMAGGGTTVDAAYRNRRRAVGADVRPSQVALMKRRLASVTPYMVVLTDEQYEQRMAAKAAKASGAAADHPEEGPEAGLFAGMAGADAGDRPGVARRGARGSAERQRPPARVGGDAGAGAPAARPDGG